MSGHWPPRKAKAVPDIRHTVWLPVEFLAPDTYPIEPEGPILPHSALKRKACTFKAWRGLLRPSDIRIARARDRSLYSGTAAVVVSAPSTGMQDWPTTSLPGYGTVAYMGTPAPARVLRQLAERYAELLLVTLKDRLVSVVLFGSVARGDPSVTSDIDLVIIVTDLPVGQFARKRLLTPADAAFEADLEKARAQGVDTRLARIVRTPREAARPVPLYLDLTEDATLLYDRDGFFASVLDQVRASLRRLGARRIRQGKAWYWDLKPDFKPGDIIEI